MNPSTTHPVPHLPACDPWRMPLTGMSLIEASAGTGKTWTMAALAVRALVVEHIAPAELALVTFTKAATQELRQRIESRLLDVLDACQRVQYGQPLPDTDGGLDVTNMQAVHALDIDTIKQRTEQTLVLFDELRVKTIHGFCLNLLQDHGHLAGLPPVEMDVLSLAHKKRQAITDAWVNINLTASPMVRGLLQASAVRLPQLLREVDAMGTAPLNAIMPQITWETCLAAHEQQVTPLVMQALQWHQEGRWQAFFDWVAANKATLKANRKPMTKFADVCSTVLSALDAANGTHERFALSLLAEPLSSFTHEQCRSILRKGEEDTWLDDPEWLSLWSWFDAFKQCQQQMQIQMAPALRWSMLCLARSVDADMLAMWGKLDNNSLMRITHEAMMNHAEMVKAVRASIKLLFVDEFQDTDLNQFEVFAQILGSADTNERGLVAVGDPKQAIYGFRGGDVFAYQLAKQQAQHCFGLHTTRRTHQGLCASINALFGLHDDVFVEPFIDYPIIDAHHHIKPHAPWAEHACHIQWLHPDGQVMDKSEANRAAIDACVARVRWMQANDWLLAEHAIDPEATNIGILVAENRQVAECKAAFEAAGLSVLAHGTNNVFAAPVAISVLHLLDAVLHPNNTQMKNMALLEGFWADSSEDAVDGLLFDAKQSLMRGHLWSALWPWLKRASLMQSGGQLHQQLWLDDAQQILTHLDEALPSLPSVTDVRFWLVKQIARSKEGDAAAADAFARRPSAHESDIVIMTQHKSKGLQFNHVLLPFAWSTTLPVLHDKMPSGFVKFHQAHTEGHRLCWDLGGEQWHQHRAQEGHETMAESMRVLYVAITRARESVWMAMADQVWPKKAVGRGSCTQTSALVRAVTGTPRCLDTGLIDVSALVGEASSAVDKKTGQKKVITKGSLLAMQQKIGDPSEPSHHQALWEPWVLKSQGQVLVQLFDAAETIQFAFVDEKGMDDAQEATEASPTKATSTNIQSCVLHDDFTHTSYSRLFSGSAHWQPLPPADAAEERIDAVENTSAVGGANFGSAVHECLEVMDIQDWPSEAQTAVLHRMAGKYALDDAASKLLTHLVKQAVERPSIDGHALMNLHPGDVLREPRFAVQLQHAHMDGLNWMLDRWRGFHVSNVLKPNDLYGLLVGAIDGLVRVNNRYIVVDYKTNRLSNYQPETLTQYVANHHYDAQYLLYALATHRWLRVHLRGYDPAIHFGGVCYLFLRGLSEEDDTAGIHRKAITPNILHALEAWAEGNDLAMIQTCWEDGA